MQDRWFVGPILIGFGTQVGLFSYLRWVSARASSSVAMTATSTGMSTGAMLACCAHHLVDVLPVLGLSGAALFLAEYQRPLFVLAIAMNLAGIAYMLRFIRRGFGLYQKESTV